jgi:hypothetical protein
VPVRKYAKREEMQGDRILCTQDDVWQECPFMLIAQNLRHFIYKYSDNLGQSNMNK